MNSIIYKIEDNPNSLYIMREDMIPYSFGGNKARKAQLFFENIDAGNYNCVVTYGSSHSNHCRIVSNMAAKRNIPCYIITPEEVSDATYNSMLMSWFGAKFVVVPVKQVHYTIEQTLTALKDDGMLPYFIPGGGHGNIGTQAYVNCYEEIRKYEKESLIHFDYIFHATGTGTTQAGLVCGQLIHQDNRKIIGISIARTNPRGRDVVIESIKEYMHEYNIKVQNEEIEQSTIFIDQYVGNGYSTCASKVSDTIQSIMINYGIPLDETYTGKAYAGMTDYIEMKSIKSKNILFIHTGGTPLFFDHLKNTYRK